jgi:hypothetical protein
MKKIIINFYSYRPRLKVGLIWTTDIVPNIGDEIRIENKFISEWDNKYFPEWAKENGKIFLVKNRTWLLDKSIYYPKDCDISIELTWTEEEQKFIDKYLEEYKKRKTGSNHT